MAEEKKGFFKRLVSGLAKTRDNIVAGFDSIFSGFSSIDEDFYEELEEILIMGDIGINATTSIIENLKKELLKVLDRKVALDIKIMDIKNPDRHAQLVAENIAQQLENRVSFRRAMKSAMSRTLKTGAKGIKAACSGRLGGADMARTEFYSEGTIPLQTLRADIDYGFAEADTTYGKIGVKVWVYNGEILPTKGTKEGSDK
mgnify:CR=1 FL=1